MDNFALFVCGVVVTLIAGMGVITSEVFLGYSKYNKYKQKIAEEQEKQNVLRRQIS